MMPRRQKSNVSVPLSPTSSYWAKFLESQNLIGIVTEEESSLKVKSPSTLTLSPDQWTLVFRVAERLTPIDGYTPEIRKKILAVREDYRKGLEQVFREQIDFKAWFIDTRRKCNMRELELMEILHDCLEGLRSPEAKELRELLGKSVDRVRMARAGITP